VILDIFLLDGSIAIVTDGSRGIGEEIAVPIAEAGADAAVVARSEDALQETDEQYYAGCEHVDEVERLAIDRAKSLWGADQVNAQPHSGTQANMGVYFGMFDPGDTILSLTLTDGGDLTHGHPANFSGQLYDVAHYHVDRRQDTSIARHSTNRPGRSNRT